ncbi:hypothetical protein C0992_012835, partial [Termitomyces sp. T32_za158]
QGPTLHLAIPALEALHSGWSKCCEQAKYKDFVPALDAALQKIKDYYDKTAESQVYTFAMLLDPSKKAAHLHKHWSKELTDQALAQAEETYKARYIEMYGSATALPPKSQQLAHVSKIKTLLRELSDSEDEIMSTDSGATSFMDNTKPWLRDFHGYLNSTDDLGKMSIIRWWGVRILISCNLSFLSSLFISLMHHDTLFGHH